MFNVSDINFTSEPPDIVTLENVAAPVFSILAVELPISVAPHQVLPLESVWNEFAVNLSGICISSTETPTLNSASF